MGWNSTFPDGAQSVRANKTIGQQNTTYIETTMALDHYWDEDAEKDGHHRPVQMVAQDPDPTLATGLDGAIYLKSDGTRIQGFYRNTNGIYQFIPAFLSGTVVMSTSSTNIVAVPANVYGEIFMYNGDSIGSSQKGFFHSDATKVYTYAVGFLASSSATPSAIIRFVNGASSTDLTIKGNLSAALGTTTFNYRIVYRAK